MDEIERTDDWVTLTPSFRDESSHGLFRDLISNLVSAVTGNSVSDPVRWAEDAVKTERSKWPSYDRPALAAAIDVSADLVAQGWEVRVTDTGVAARRPCEAEDPMVEKARIRAQEILKRDEQLREPAVADFIESMERRRLHNGRHLSVFHLMRDGRELAAALDEIALLDLEQRPEALERVVDPYVQIVTANAVCSRTGFKLQDVWRYFRHTWANHYVSVPGRSMAFLVRDAAADFHPVIGIGSLASAVIQLGVRDAWIGWEPKAFVEAAHAKPTGETARWFMAVVDEALAEIFVEDLLEQKVLLPGWATRVSGDLIDRLRQLSAEARERHHQHSAQRDHKSLRRDDFEHLDDYFEARARSDLFLSKRALALADLLDARVVLAERMGEPTAENLRRLLSSDEGRRVARKLVKRAKAERVGISLADISVCGAVPPYNPILGGKLVSILAASPEIVAAYRRRYQDAESEIASSVAGRCVRRSPELVFLGTTSLYGSGSSQYNRLKVPSSVFGCHDAPPLEYIDIGRSEAWGTSHFSKTTLREFDRLLRQRGAKRVKHIFGEGASPKLRELRGALDVLGLPSDELLKHGRRRIVYAIPLVKNPQRFLLGLESRPSYIFPMQDVESETKALTAWWRERWLAKRIARPDVRDQVRRHNKVHPIEHGARVRLPNRSSKGSRVVQDDLFPTD